MGGWSEKVCPCIVRNSCMKSKSQVFGQEPTNVYNVLNAHGRLGQLRGVLIMRSSLIVHIMPYTYTAALLSIRGVGMYYNMGVYNTVYGMHSILCASCSILLSRNGERPILFLATSGPLVSVPLPQRKTSRRKTQTKV